MTAIVFNPEGQTIRRSDTPQALARHARSTKPQRVRCDNEHRLLEITYANGDVGRADFPTTEAMLEWVKRRRLIFREARFLGCQ
jgi:YD repeat-containing protein